MFELTHSYELLQYIFPKLKSYCFVNLELFWQEVLDSDKYQLHELDSEIWSPDWKSDYIGTLVQLTLEHLFGYFYYNIYLEILNFWST